MNILQSPSAYLSLYIFRVIKALFRIDILMPATHLSKLKICFLISASTIAALPSPLQFLGHEEGPFPSTSDL